MYVHFRKQQRERERETVTLYLYCFEPLPPSQNWSTGGEGRGEVGMLPHLSSNLRVLCILHLHFKLMHAL